MRKTFIVTVDIDPELNVIYGQGSEAPAIAASLSGHRFLHIVSVDPAPDSFQPINNDSPKPGVFYDGRRLGTPDVEFVDYVSPHPENSEGSTEE